MRLSDFLAFRVDEMLPLSLSIVKVVNCLSSGCKPLPTFRSSAGSLDETTLEGVVDKSCKWPTPVALFASPGACEAFVVSIALLEADGTVFLTPGFSERFAMCRSKSVARSVRGSRRCMRGLKTEPHGFGGLGGPSLRCREICQICQGSRDSFPLTEELDVIARAFAKFLKLTSSSLSTGKVTSDFQPSKPDKKPMLIS